MQSQNPSILVVTDILGHHYIEKKKLVYIEAERNYCSIHYLDEDKRLICITVSKPLAHFHEQLTDLLLRVHRSTAVNRRYIKATIRGQIIALSCTDRTLRASKEGFKAARILLGKGRPGKN